MSKEDSRKHVTGIHEDVLAAVKGALRGADPLRMMNRYLNFKNGVITAGEQKYDLRRFKRILVIGGGKASARMALAMEKILGEKIDAGVVIAPHYQIGNVRTERIKIVYGGHPVPDMAGVKAVTHMFEMVGAPRPDDLIICLISGGGSSLLALPHDRINLEDVKMVTKLLLDSGADIYELNVVRKHLSGTQGGRFAERIYPATVIALIISDVVGNDIATIASGPTAPDASTFLDAVSIMKKRRVWKAAPPRVKKFLEDGINGRTPETPKPGSDLFRRVQNLLIGDNYDACLGSQREMLDRGYRADILTTQVVGEARSFGLLLSSIARGISNRQSSVKGPVAMIFGGETTVRVTGRGRGGRNQEVALSASKGISSLPNVVVCSFGTDGVDGVTSAAGGMVDGFTYPRALSLGLDVEKYLRNNDSYTLLKATGNLLTTGPTGTNVGDVMMVVVGKDG